MSPETKTVKQTLLVDTKIDGEIRRHGEETYPHECCGALVGAGNRVTATVALPNTTEEGPRRRFMVRPSDYRVADVCVHHRGRGLWKVRGHDRLVSEGRSFDIRRGRAQWQLRS